MTTLYHGGSHIIQTPEIREPNRTLDFGVGFYTTTSMQQAEKLVRDRIRRRKWDCGYINSYDFDLESARSCLSIIQFETPNEDWVNFVLQNRNIIGFTHDYDIVVGPVANDNVYQQFALFENGVISKETLIRELLPLKLVDQFLFHTEASLKFLKYQTNKLIKP